MAYAVEHVTVQRGRTVAVHRFGGAGEPLVMLHATGFCAALFAPIAAALGDRFDCVGIDLPGHGDSPAPRDGDFRWTGFAADVLAALKGLGINNAYGFGHSCGATTMLLAEQHRPTTFRAMYCYEPAMGFRAATGPVAANAMSEAARRRRAAFASLAELREYLAGKALFARFDATVLDAYVSHGFTEQSDGSLVLKCAPESEAATFAHGAAHDCLARLTEIGCPVTFAYGDAPDSFPAVLRDAVVRGLPGSEYSLVDGLGHLGPFEDPSRIAGEITNRFGSRPVGGSLRT